MTHHATSSFPFDCVVVTCPDEEAAEAAFETLHTDLNRILQQRHNGQKVHLISTCDPYGARCGSGGGTLAALEEAFADAPAFVTTQSRICVLHAGGDSSRCPSLMILGKAWLSLPSSTHTNPTTWLLLQLAGLVRKTHIPMGSVVIAATDVILDLGQILCSDDDSDDDSAEPTAPSSHHTFRQLKEDEPAVVGLSIPAPLHVAKNHGVFILSKQLVESRSTNVAACIADPIGVWQKPSVHELKGQHLGVPASFRLPSQDGQDDADVNGEDAEHGQKEKEVEEEQAWIDTGIIIFTPKAVDALRGLSTSTLALCTRTGLKKHYDHLNPGMQNTQNGKNEANGWIKGNEEADPCEDSITPGTSSTNNGAPSFQDQNMKAFAKKHALSIDLYTDILHNLQYNKESDDAASGNEVPSHQDEMQLQLAAALGDIPLKVMTLIDGGFTHLGTTKELQQFLLNVTDAAANAAAASTATSAAAMDILSSSKANRILTSIARSLNATARVGTCFLPDSTDGAGVNSNSTQIRNVVMHSVFSLRYPASLGNGSVVEYCNMLSTNNRMIIGDNSILSGWRSSCDGHTGDGDSDTCTVSKRAEKCTRIPNNLCVQILPLKKNQIALSPTNPTSTVADLVYMVVGINDNTKRRIADGTIYGMPPDQFFVATNLKPVDIGLSADLDGPADIMWNATIHPLVRDGTSWSSVFDWLNGLVGCQNKADASIDDASFQRWKSLPKVSLKQLHGMVSARDHWRHRRETMIEVQLRSSLNQQLEKLKSFQHNGQQRQEQHDGDRAGISSSLASIEGAIDRLEGVLRRAISCQKQLVCCQASRLIRAFLLLALNLHETSSSPPPVSTAEVEAQGDIRKPRWTLDPIPDDVLNTFSMQLSTNESRLDALEKIVQLRKVASLSSVEDIRVLETTFRALSAKLMMTCIQSGFTLQQERNQLAVDAQAQRHVPNAWCVATSPVRIDLGGGWGDTPPISYEYGGSIAGMAVAMDGLHPLSCRSRVTAGKRGIKLRSEYRTMGTGDLISEMGCMVSDVADFGDYNQPTSTCALLKCTLICLGLISVDDIHSNDSGHDAQKGDGRSLQTLLNEFCNTSEDVGIEIITASLLPQGSGMGTSSILAGCVLMSVAKAVGIGDLSNDFVFHAVLMIEQLLTTGGGYQDQVHGVVPGIKLVRSSPYQVPIDLSVDRIRCSDDTLSAINRRFVLAFTGKPRLAKGILQHVLDRWTRQSDEIVDTVSKLHVCSRDAADAVASGDVDGLGRALSAYWKLKCAMAGPESGVEPREYRELVSVLRSEGMILGASLCGAGGGGFMVAVASEGHDCESIKKFLESKKSGMDDGGGGNGSDFSEMTWHSIDVCSKGASCRVISTATMSGAEDKEVDEANDGFRLGDHRL